ncbi:DUF4329 domain-containing protein [Hoeflea sp. TYP-13]|uniref:DUF4329 domain-containing protein n=1 Tax=Hoeflea sp. TYP-13 TaxID=3230023 RepID=UPI0034C6CA52
MFSKRISNYWPAIPGVCFVVAIAWPLLAQEQSEKEPADDLDTFAISHLDKIQPRSIRDNAEYCGLFGYDENGEFAATPAIRGGRDGCNPGIEPDGLEVIASYHTHGAYSPDADTEAPSVDDLLGDFEEGIDGYIATPSGRVWLNLLEERVSVLLCDPGCVYADPNFRACPAFLPDDEYTIETLREREAADTGEC